MSKGNRFSNVDFVERQKATARAYDNSYERRGIEVRVSEKSCSNCARKKHCTKNQIRVTDGAASIGSESISCEKWLEIRDNFQNSKQVAILLRSFTKLR